MYQARLPANSCPLTCSSNSCALRTNSCFKAAITSTQRSSNEATEIFLLEAAGDCAIEAGSSWVVLGRDEGLVLHYQECSGKTK